MGKAGLDKRTALANALSSSGAAKVPPTKKAPAKTQPDPAQSSRRKKEPEPEVVEKTKKEIEEEQRQLLKENERQKASFYEIEAAKKLQDCQGIDVSVTYIEDKDTRKPKAVKDLSDYWVLDIDILPFMPTDNVEPTEIPDDIDINERLEYLRLLNEQLAQLLKMRFNIFWCQFIYNPNLRRFIDSYLRFALRTYDVDAADKAAERMDPFGIEQRALTREISRKVLSIVWRLSRPEETSHDFISEERFGELIYENGIFDIPKLIDICAIYGDTNRPTVTKIAHSVFGHQPRYKDDFRVVVEHMLTGLHQCCTPLQRIGARDSAGVVHELSIKECMLFLPDILSCFNAMFCFFPEDCVELLVDGSPTGSAVQQASVNADAEVPLANSMVQLHAALMALKDSNHIALQSKKASETFAVIISLLSRLLSRVLGFRMAPKCGPAGFANLTQWLESHKEQNVLLQDLGQNGLENVVMEWSVSGHVEDAQLDLFEELCGPFLPPDARSGRKPARASSQAARAQIKPTGASHTSDAAKIREVREVVGMEYGEGFVLQCLLHYSGSVPAVVEAIIEGSLPPQLKSLPHNFGLHDDPLAAVASAGSRPAMSTDEKRRVIEMAAKQQRDGLEIDDIMPADDYDDDFDDNYQAAGFKVGAANESASEATDDENDESGGEQDGSQQNWTGKGYGKGCGTGKGYGTGKGKGRGKGPVQGQTIQARRKEANKAKFANHNRKDQQMKKMTKGMM